MSVDFCRWLLLPRNENGKEYFHDRRLVQEEEDDGTEREKSGRRRSKKLVNAETTRGQLQHVTAGTSESEMRERQVFFVIL